MQTLDLRAEQRHSQALSPRLQHAVRLLQMSSLDFAALVRNSLGSNPFLEGEEGEEGDADSELAADSDPASDGVTAGADGDRDLWQACDRGAARNTEDGALSALERMPVEVALNTHLHNQLNLLALAPRDRLLAHALVEMLDDDGYLRAPLQELGALAELEPATSTRELRIALRRVQSLEPAGVGARSVAECLRLQLPAIECPRLRALARIIVSEHLEALAARDIGGLARRLGENGSLVEAACDCIRRLDPRPGWRLSPAQAHYIVPDVVVKRVRGRWNVQLNPAVVPRVRLNQVYAELFQRHRSADNGELAGHLQEARWTLRNVAQRFSTILDVAQAIVRRQRYFLEYGAMAMKPLGLREIADEVGIHESTVSRVTNNKFMATPIGVFEMKYFFSRAMISRNGSACSGTAIRGLVRDIVDSERVDAPLSDPEITRQLARQGLVVARRTVTKYRQMLKIEPVDRRRRLA